MLSLCTAPAMPAGPTTTADYVHAASLKGLHQWDHFPVRVSFDRSDAYSEERRKQVLAGFDEWVGATGGVLSYTVVDSDDMDDADITVRLLYSPNVPPDPHTVGQTATQVRGKRTLVQARMRLATGGLTSEALTEAAAHEFGHALGINGHSDDPADLMYGSSTRILYPATASTSDRPSRSLRRPTARDINTIKAAYPERFAEAAKRRD
jgi:predicted Zn-dependent protease